MAALNSHTKPSSVLFSVIIAASTLMLFAPNLLAFGRAASAATELFKLIEQKSNINPFKPSGYKPNQTEGYIDIQTVGFSYPSRPGVTVLDDFTLKVPAGKMTALVVSSMIIYERRIKLKPPRAPVALERAQLLDSLSVGMTQRLDRSASTAST